MAAPSVKPRRRAASAWDRDSTSPSSQGFSVQIARLARRSELACQHVEGALNECQRPLPVKHRVGHRTCRIGDLQFGGGARAGARFDGDDQSARRPAWRPGRGRVGPRGSASPRRAERSGTARGLGCTVSSPPPARSRAKNSWVRSRAASSRAVALADECQHRRIVGLAQFTQRRLCRRRFAPRPQNERPAGRQESRWALRRIFGWGGEAHLSTGHCLMALGPRLLSSPTRVRPRSSFPRPRRDQSESAAVSKVRQRRAVRPRTGRSRIGLPA